MTCFLFSVRCAFSHRFSLDLMISSIGSQGVWSLASLPIHAPSILTASPSWVILISRGRGLVSCGLIFRDSFTVLLWDFFPIGIISVFLMLNLAPDILHHLSRIFCMWSSRSSLLRNRLVSSAKSIILIVFSMPGIVIPLILGLAQMQQASSSIARSKRGHKSGSSCQTLRLTLKVPLNTPFMVTLVWALLYKAWTIRMKGWGRWNVL